MKLLSVRLRLPRQPTCTEKGGARQAGVTPVARATRQGAAGAVAVTRHVGGGLLLYLIMAINKHAGRRLVGRKER
ncbi:hypothetical protein [Parageobacillus thermoglucosidasius]|uniref:hypothetical protein n=1 Tax=Parageobacillus thermoglucosidasius TaxID=1426 RepID=UPI0030C70EC3